METLLLSWSLLVCKQISGGGRFMPLLPSATLYRQYYLPPLSYPVNNVAYYPEAEHPPFSCVVHVGISVLSVFYPVLGSTSCILRTRKGSPNTSNSTKEISSLSGGLDFCFVLHSGRPTTSCFWEPDLEFLRAVSA